MVWIKFDHSTGDKPEIFQMAEILNIDPDAVIGKLCRIWVWADAQTVDGNAPSVTRALLDRLANHVGFMDAMEKVGWLTRTKDGIHFTNFDRHNGNSAKNRALTALRVEKHRAGADGVSPKVKRSCNAKCNAPSVTKTLPEKRREDEIRNKEPQTPSEKPEAEQTALPVAAPAEPGGQGDSFDLKSRKKSTKPVPPLMIPDNLAANPGFVEAWSRWETYRRELKKPLVPETRNSQLEMLARHGPVKAIEVLAKSITNGWTGLFLDDTTNSRKNGKDTRPPCITNPSNATKLF